MELFEIIQDLSKSEKNLIQSSSELNKAIDHIALLLKGASSLYFEENYTCSVFLSITACEEIAKAHVGLYTDGIPSNKKSRNIFKDHKTKHKLAAIETVSMGKRLIDAIGKGEVDRIMRIAQNAGFIQIRESSLYFQRENGNLVVPHEKVDSKIARSLLLFAIEVFDDALNGLTTHSSNIANILDDLFERIKRT